MNSDIVRCRELFLAGNMPSDHNLRSEVYESWIRSKQAKIDPYSSVLPTHLSPEASVAIEGKDLLLRQASDEQTSKLYELLEKTGSVLFYINSDLIIVIARGNKQLLDKLESINLGIGSHLNENIVGTNAAALSALSNLSAQVIGSEHYIEALQDFACMSYPTTNIDGGLSDKRAMFVTPIANYNIYQFFTYEIFLSLVDYRLNFQWRNTELLMVNELTTQSIEQIDKGLIFVNANGYILKTNVWITANLHREGRNEKFLNIFPELHQALDCMQTGKSVQIHEVSLLMSPTKSDSFYMNSEPIKKDKKIIGMVVTIYNKKYIHKNIARICNLQSHFNFDDIIGSSTNLVAVKKAALKAANSPSTILITGESGTGKELFAQAIHNASKRKNGPFIPINCAAIPRELIGSELFGYNEGSFTGARKGGAPGKFELADKGTIFLDEIGEMPLDMQAILLRVLEDKMVTRLGSSNPIPLNVKIISATNRNLWESVKSHHFRLDLYYRLNIVEIGIPPLRERKDDIPLLVDNFIKQLSPVFDKNIKEMTPNAIALLQSYNWPGNVRELRNVIERGLNQCDSDVLTSADLPSKITLQYLNVESNLSSDLIEEDIIDEDLVNKKPQRIEEKRKLLQLMERYNGNKTLVAKELGISRVTLYKKLKTY